MYLPSHTSQLYTSLIFAATNKTKNATAPTSKSGMSKNINRERLNFTYSQSEIYIYVEENGVIRVQICMFK